LGHSEAAPPGNDPKPKVPWGCLIAFLVVAVPVVLVSRMISPSDWVDVTVGPLPNGYEKFCLVAEDSKGISALPWYHSKVIPFTEDPFMGGTLGGGFWDPDNDGVILASVQWREAKRYGVLIHRRDDQWQLQWLGPGDVQLPPAMRVVFGGGKAEMRLPAQSHTLVPSRHLLEQLGLSRE
jgi:hypothetical protein